MWARGLIEVGGNRGRMMASVDRMTPGDMPQFDPSMRMALKGFRSKPQAGVRHMIIISDGDPAAPGANIIQAMKTNQITCSTVGIGFGAHVMEQTMRSIAQQTKGKYYAVKNPRKLPQIFIKEAKVIKRPLIGIEVGIAVAGCTVIDYKKGSSVSPELCE